MSHEISAATDGFQSSPANRHFIYNPLSDISVVVETSDMDMQVCSVASRVALALDYGAGPEAQRLMHCFIDEARGKGSALALTLKSNDQPQERKSEMTFDSAPVKDSFTPAADPVVAATDARTKSDFDISAEYGGTQYAAAVQKGFVFEGP